MTNILGTIYNAAGIPVSGRLVVNLVNSMVDDTAIPPSLFIPQSYEFTITDGVVDIDLEESETKKTSYEFIFYVPSVEDPLIEEVLNPFPFKAIVPNYGSVNLIDLLPTGIVSDTLATGALRVAKIIAATPELAANVGGVFPRGDWNALVSDYKRGDIVNYLDRTYIANSQVPLGEPPTNDIYWQYLPLEVNGSLALGDATPYGTAWGSSGLAASQNTIYDKIESITHSPTFTGTVTLPSTTTIGSVSNTELSYLSGVTSSIQTQINTKANTNSPTFTGTVNLPNTTNIGLVSATELEYLDGVTSPLQTQLNNKANLVSPTFTGTVVLPSTTSIGTVSSTELSYLDGVTSSIQSQLDSKLSAGSASINFTSPIDATNGGANNLVNIDITGIPSDARRITIILNNIAYSDNAGSTADTYFQVQLGTSGGIETTGYEGNADGNTFSNTSFPFTRNTDTNTQLSGLITLINPNGNIWIMNGMVGRTSAANNIFISAGRKTLAGVLSQIRVSFADTNKRFNSGNINVAIEK